MKCTNIKDTLLLVYDIHPNGVYMEIKYKEDEK